jgi:hypothetical protein
MVDIIMSDSTIDRLYSMCNTVLEPGMRVYFPYNILECPDLEKVAKMLNDIQTSVITEHKKQHKKKGGGIAKILVY